MATIKICTDLEQSEVLSKILSPESADMYFEPSAGFRTEPSEVRVGDIKYAHPRSIRCWSLAALLNAVDFSTINLHYDNVRMDWVASATMHDSTKHCTKYESARALNPVDACYKLILKLHELNLL